jgi:excisionase family DNA binding protein
MRATVKHDAYIGTTEAARLLGISRQAVLKRIRAGTLEAAKVGRNYVVPVAAVRPGRDGAALLAADPVLADVVDRLVRGYDPERVYLFGSSARGDAGPDSDYDIMLVMPDDAPAERMDARDAYSDHLWGTGAPVDVLIVSRTYFDEAVEYVVASLPATILREGALLYVA